ncbi:MAG TPA: hypothetical protein VGK73_07395 [Polyangiaceae bacterium]
MARSLAGHGGIARLVTRGYRFAMRWLVWCAAGVLFACGKSGRPSSDGGGGRGGTAGDPAGDGGEAAVSSGGVGSGGVAAGGAGTSGANGGAGTSGTNGGAGTSGTDGGAGVAGSGQGGTGGSDVSGGNGGSSAANDGGEAGNAGAAGELECPGTYTACGCGCCGGTTPNAACIYPERGDSLTSIRDQDRIDAADPACANAGCGIGNRYVCCVSAPEEQATYSTTGYSSDAQYLRIRRESGDRCTSLWIRTGGVETPFPLDLPNNFRFYQTYDGPCAQENSAASERPAIGALGSVLDTAPLGCTLDLDFTLFFTAIDGAVDSVRFAARGVRLPDLPEACR